MQNTCRRNRTAWLRAEKVLDAGVWAKRCQRPGMLGYVVGPRGRREAVQRLAGVRARLEAAGHALAAAADARKQAESEYDAASDRFRQIQQELEEAMDQRATARQARYAARQEHERAAALMDRLQRRERELSQQLDGLALTGLTLALW